MCVLKGGSRKSVFYVVSTQRAHSKWEIQEHLRKDILGRKNNGRKEHLPAVIVVENAIHQ